MIAGKWGSGDERKKLTRPAMIITLSRKEGERLLKGKYQKCLVRFAKEVVSRKWGNGADRKKNWKQPVTVCPNPERSKQTAEITAEKMVLLKRVCTSEENISHTPWSGTGAFV